MEKDQLISMIHFLVKREDEPTNEASAEPNSFELCIARRRKNIIQRAQENQELNIRSICSKNDATAICQKTDLLGDWYVKSIAKRLGED